MVQRVVLALAAAAIVALALLHPAPQPAFTSSPSPAASFTRPVTRDTGHARTPGHGDVVYVAGAVRRPGLYRLAAGSRGADAVAAAGGMAPSADAGGVNLAAPVSDGDEVFVPVAGAKSPARARSRAHRTRRSRAISAPPIALDVNIAAADQLAAVPGIGSSLAARIVAMREADGAFASLDELLDVAGMTQARLERARPYLLAR
jgi:competence protein ComEA